MVLPTSTPPTDGRARSSNLPVCPYPTLHVVSTCLYSPAVLLLFLLQITEFHFTIHYFVTCHACENISWVFFNYPYFWFTIWFAVSVWSIFPHIITPDRHACEILPSITLTKLYLRVYENKPYLLKDWITWHICRYNCTALITSIQPWHYHS